MIWNVVTTALSIVGVIVTLLGGCFLALLWWDHRRWGPFERNDLER